MFTTSYRHFENYLQIMLADGLVLLSMQGDSCDHVVLAYAIETIDQTHFRVDVLDSHHYYLGSEASDVTGIPHKRRQHANSLLLDLNGWGFPDPPWVEYKRNPPECQANGS